MLYDGVVPNGERLKFLFTVVFIKHYRYSLGSFDLQCSKSNLTNHSLARILSVD